uniref:Uncharacterized protein n=1 Tax=Rhizophagus irregularis (strain DAOM 181602 / DAOM 197198 / MUCL 43194) TaxID=747089 RepID=U9USE4_RHIID
MTGFFLLYLLELEDAYFINWTPLLLFFEVKLQKVYLFNYLFIVGAGRNRFWIPILKVQKA